MFCILLLTLRANCKIQCTGAGLIPLLQQGISEPELYGELVYKSTLILERPYFPDQYKI